jgi:hypothetical protein
MAKQNLLTAQLKADHNRRVKELEDANAAAKATIKEKDKLIQVQYISHYNYLPIDFSNIVSTCSIKNIMPNATIVRELPGIRFVRYCRTVLAHVSQTLAVYEIALAEVIEQSHTDGTSRRQTAMQNFVVRVLREGGSRRVTLASCASCQKMSLQHQLPMQSSENLSIAANSLHNGAILKQSSTLISQNFLTEYQLRLNYPLQS